MLEHVESAVDVLDALVGGPGGSTHDEPLETALDHLYLAASALRHRPTATPDQAARRRRSLN
ncbi:MAG TPA: hypothetical protein VHG90_12280 [Acidimicrobiales bacterium]|nr:hypothetical protein [Acidimicrobiales bacterium]